MTKGASKHGHEVSQPAPKVVATIGLITCAPMATTGYSSKTRKLADGSRAQEQSYERVSKINHEDKKSASYERFTTKEKVSSGRVYTEKGSGQVVLKNEFKRSSTFKVGNKRGYTEYYTEERIRDVGFSNDSSYNSSSNNNRLTYDYGHGYDYDNGYDY